MLAVELLLTINIERHTHTNMAGKKEKRKADDGSDRGVTKKQRHAGTSKPFAIAESALDPALSSLFTITRPVQSTTEGDAKVEKKQKGKAAAVKVDNEQELSETDSVIPDDDDPEQDIQTSAKTEKLSRRKRKRDEDNQDLEADYFDRLARSTKADQQTAPAAVAPLHSDDDDAQHDSDRISNADSDLEPPPQHISLQPETDEDIQKAQRTVFLSNVSTKAIKSKSARKELLSHMSSFFSALPKPEKSQPTHSVESIRFRSTAYAGKIPKKAAFAKKELMDATTLSTNAYLVYSSQSLAREAARKLNGTIVLSRHIHVDEIAHPAKVDHHRCVFIGNLGFVDDESNIDKANAESGRENRRGRKVPSDVEEGLWQTFSQCGAVENVRVIRDSKTRVGKGIAYVQFVDEVSVESALQFNEKKFPPMLPRKLRVSRAKAIKRNTKPSLDSTRARAQIAAGPRGKGGYVPKITPQQQSQLGRANRLLGHHAAARMQSGKAKGVQGVRDPESFVFEGHRASASASAKVQKKKGKPTTRSSKRGSAWKAKEISRSE